MRVYIAQGARLALVSEAKEGHDNDADTLGVSEQCYKELPK